MFIRQRLSSVLFVLGFFVLLLVLAETGQGQDKPNPIFEQVKAKVKDPGKPFTMVVRIQVKDGAGARFEEAFAPALKGTRKEKGCIAYDLNRDVDHPNVYFVYERWKTLPDLDAHLKAPYIQALLPKLGDLTTGAPELKVFMPASE